MRGIGTLVCIGMVASTLLLGGSPARGTCAGDCGGDGEVTVDDIIVGVNIALGLNEAAACTAMDSDADGEVTVDELVSAVNAAVGGCPSAATPTPQPHTETPAATASATPTPTPIETVATPPACDSDGTAALTATSAVPASGSGPLAATCVTAENAGGTRTELTRVTVRGNVNGQEMRLQVYFVTATGAIDTVSYAWVPFAGMPDLYENLAFCNAPGCTGVAVSLGTKTIAFTDTALAGDSSSAVLNGTITLDSLPEPEATPTPPCPGGSATLAFSDVEGTNSSRPLPATLPLGAAMNFSRPADPPTFAYLSAQYDGCPMAFPSLSLSFQFSGAPLQTGATYQVGNIQGNLNQIEFREQGFSNSKSWEAQSGSVVVDAVDSSGVTFRIVDARMRPKDAGTRGTFTLNVSGTLAPVQ